MATFNLGSGTDLNSLDDISKVKSYLFQLTEQLRYMFNNLDPQENFSELARLTMVTDGERQASIEASLDAIRLNYVSKDGIVSAINLSEELIQIEASKIKLEGVVTVNGNFKVGLDGSIEATNGKFNGDISASNITGSTIKGSHIEGTTIGTTNEAFYVLPDTYEGSPTTKIGLSGFRVENHRILSNTAGTWENPMLSDYSENANIAMHSNSGEAGIETLYTHDAHVDGTLYVSGLARGDIASEIFEIWQRIEAIDDGGEDDPPVGGDPL